MPWQTAPMILFTPWSPFDLKTLLHLYKQNPWYQTYIRRFSLRPLLPGLNRPKLLRYPQYEIGIYTTYQQTWQLLGYSRGALLSSISLAPKEELSIEIFTFDRFKTESESTFSTEFEKNLEINSQARASSQVAHDLTTTTDTKADLGLGIPLPAG